MAHATIRYLPLTCDPGGLGDLANAAPRRWPDKGTLAASMEDAPRSARSCVVPAGKSHGGLALAVWTLADANEMGSWWVRNRAHLQLTQAHRLEGHWTAAGQADRIRVNAADVESGRLVPMLIREDGMLVGEVILSDVSPDGPSSIGYAVDRLRLGRRIATDAVGAVVQMALTDMGISVLEANTSSHNLTSQRVLLRNGFVRIDEHDAPGEPAEATWRRTTIG